MNNNGDLIKLYARFDEKTLKTIYLSVAKGDLKVFAAKSPDTDSSSGFFEVTVEMFRVIKMEHPKPAKVCYGVSKHIIGFLYTHLTLEDLYAYEGDLNKILLLHSKPEAPVNLFFIFCKELAQQIIFKAMNEKIKIWVMSTEFGRYVSLTPGEIQKIRIASEEKDYNRAYLHLRGSANGQFVGMNDLFVCKHDADKILAELNEGETKRRAPRYSTHLLKIQDEAIKHFWEKHDPKYPPKREDVLLWLVEEKKITKHEAEAIDLIIRSEEAKKGGNKKMKIADQKTVSA